MNANIGDADASIRYYDSDYPSAEFGPYPENFDDTVELQGVAFDVARYRELARETGGPVLELCCGTGRVAIPLARDGARVTAVDVSAGMLERLAANLAGQPQEVVSRITRVRQDATALALDERDFRLAILAFNSLLCIDDFEGQCRAVEAAAAHLAPGGLLALHAVNPRVLALDGDPVPKPFFTRRNVATGHVYTRFAMSDPADETQRQRLHGWYDEVDDAGVVRRTPYSLHWRPIFRFEAELMLRRAGFSVVALEGGHRREPFLARSPTMFFVAART